MVEEGGVEAQQAMDYGGVAAPTTDVGEVEKFEAGFTECSAECL